MKAHNQFQFQEIYKQNDLKLRKGPKGFAQVNYIPGKHVEIFLETDRGYLELDKRPGETEEQFVCRAVMAFNMKEFNC